MTESLTEQEIAVLDLLARASRAFYDLPEHHPSDLEEWAHELHILQHRVMRRLAIRCHPDYFTPMVSHQESPPEHLADYGGTETKPAPAPAPAPKPAPVLASPPITPPGQAKEKK